MQHSVSDRQGLTLVELILALLILTVAFLIMIQTFGRGLILQQQVAGQSQAMLVAQAQMEALLRDASGLGVSFSRTGTLPEDPKPVDAAAVGINPDAAEGYTWQVTVAPHEDQPEMREITLRLVWTERGRERHLELVSLASSHQ
jgi:type II secretory pathway pseudopilin PulG